MASRWSSEHLVTEHRDIQASTMAVDQTGQLALLAGKRALAVVKLSKPTESVHKVARISKWEISAVQWNPHASHANNFVTACNQRADVWAWNESRGEIKGTLKAHTRVISDLDWSPFNPDIVSTCSVDTFTFLWDIRDTRKPTLSLQGISGASQVKWNKVNSHLLATCHDGDIRVWDPRKGNTPVQYIAGHLSKIFGLDWSPDNECQLATSSQDCTVKFWDISNPRQSIDKLTTTGSPVWRARYTPFGTGLVTVVLPQLRRGENSLFLWNRSELHEAVHTFVGHTDVVLEFQWRSPQIGDNNYQLVTWSKDQTLRLWTVDPLLQKMCGADIDIKDSNGDDMAYTDDLHIQTTDLSQEQSLQTNNTAASSKSSQSDKATAPEDGMESKQPKNIVDGTPPRNSAKIRRDENIHSPQQPKTLSQEFQLVNFENVSLDERGTSILKRTCTVTAESSNEKFMVKLKMIFPEAYPYNAVPSFQFETSNIDQPKQTKLINALRETASQYVKYNRSCIEPCLEQLAAQLNSMTEDENGDDTSSESSFKLSQSQPPLYRYLINNSQMAPYNYIPFQDQAVPFPRTSGARFCANGVLVCFTRQAEAPIRRVSTATDVTPRAMSELSAYSISSQVHGSRTPLGPTPFKIFGVNRSPPSDSNVSLRNYYTYIDTRTMHHSSREKTKPRRSRSRSRHSDPSDPANPLVRSPKKDNKNTKSRVGPVVIYDVTGLLPIDYQLAEKYMLDTSDISHMCTHNASLAASVGRKDLIQLWSLIGMVTNPILKPGDSPDSPEPWAQHPFGRKMLKSLIRYYIGMKDVQTLAMITCALGSKYDPEKTLSMSMTSKSSKSSSEQKITQPSNTPANSEHHLSSSQNDSYEDSWMFTVSKMKRSSSLSDMLGDYVFTPQRDPVQVEKELHEQNIRLLDMNTIAQYDQYKCCYADILYRMGLLNQRAQILKYVSTPPEPHKGIEFKSNCYHCGNESRGAQCWHNNCRMYAFRCDICHVSVKGASSFCLACGHGGHSNHMMEWFKSHEVCPTGCGCNCLQTNPMSPESDTEHH